MTLLSPAALALLAIAAPIALLYMIRVRRRERVVPATMLWRRAAQVDQTSANWRRMRPSLLLILQLLALAALVLALAQPAYTHSRTYAGDVVVIVDQSIAMQAKDVAPSRLAEAQRRARQIAADLADGSVMSVIGMGASRPGAEEPAKLAIAESSNRDALDRAIDSLDTISTPANGLASFSAALGLAESLTRRGHTTQIVVLTSRDSGITGQLNLTARLPVQLSAPVEIDRIGGTVQDLGIVAFRASPLGAATQAVLRVTNFGTSRATSDLQLWAGRTGHARLDLLDVRPLLVAPGKTQTEVWTTLPGAITSLQARLTLHDDMSVDKIAWALIPHRMTTRVLLVTGGGYFLQTALKLAPGVKLTVISPRQYASPAGDLPPTDLLVLDRYLPQSGTGSLPPGATLLVNPPAGTLGDLRIGPYRRVGSASAVPNLPGSLAALLQYVDLSDVHVARARRLTLPGWMQPVITSGGATLVAAGEEGGRRLAVVGFGLEESDWPLRLSLPVAVRNLLTYLTPGLTIGSSSLVAGQPVQLYPAPGTQEIRITRPDGGVDRIFPQTTAGSPEFLPYTGTGRPGLYLAREIEAGHEIVVPFAVNAFGARAKSSATGPDVLRFGAAPTGGTSNDVSENVAWGACLIVLALLGTEWWYSMRKEG